VVINVSDMRRLIATKKLNLFTVLHATLFSATPVKALQNQAIAGWIKIHQINESLPGAP